jgi:hypothetical protein
MKCPKRHAENTDTARFCSNCAAALTQPGGRIFRALKQDSSNLFFINNPFGS